ncbi:MULTISPECIES: SDR family NAD(P)-dependent oxidoreductase [Streptomyces]|uniref:SDR family NAD(P)-dependent oxidoreductase n=1 Tax=Streptomyces TaxID=1883 RepID=UPI001C3112F9|nr:SDR family oxidoreductase [Streptomyces sp. GbtcB7]
MDLQLTGKTAVVTGGSKGIGLEVVRLLLAEGVRVVTGSRTVTPELKETDAVSVIADLSTPDGPAQLINAAVAELGGIDILVNNVGVGDSKDLAEDALLNLAELPEEEWERSFNLHFYSALRAIKAALPTLTDRRGVVINVSSIAARDLSAGPINYAAAKGALNALTKAVAAQFGDQGIRAITISPGPVSTGVWTDPDGFMGTLAKAQGVTMEALQAQSLATLGASTGRVSTPQEVARLIVFAASPNNITGHDLVVDGGVIKAL